MLQNERKMKGEKQTTKKEWSEKRDRRPGLEGPSVPVAHTGFDPTKYRQPIVRAFLLTRYAVYPCSKQAVLPHSH